MKSAIARQQQNLPLAVMSVLGAEKATRVADVCNSHVDLDGFISAKQGGGFGEMIKKMTKIHSTPAQRLRRLAHRDGHLGQLTLEEKKWCILDQSLYPDKWEWWLRDKGLGREQVDVDDIALKRYRLEKCEIERILKTPLWQLGRGESAMITWLLPILTYFSCNGLASH